MLRVLASNKLVMEKLERQVLFFGYFDVFSFKKLHDSLKNAKSFLGVTRRVCLVSSDEGS